MFNPIINPLLNDKAVIKRSACLQEKSVSLQAVAVFNCLGIIEMVFGGSVIHSISQQTENKSETVNMSSNSLTNPAIARLSNFTNAIVFAKLFFSR